MTKHTTEVDGTRVDVEKHARPMDHYHLVVQMVNEDGDGASELDVRLSRALDSWSDLDPLRSLGVDEVARAVANIMDEMDLDTDRLIRAEIEARRTVRRAYGPSRDHFDWIDAPREEFDRAAEERAERSRRAQEGR